MTTHLQGEQNETLLPLELIRRSLKLPTTLRSSPQEHPSIPGLSNSQPDHPMETPVSPLRTPRGSGSQISWEQASLHPTPTKQAASPYIACPLRQEGDEQGEESSSHRAPRQPLFPLYPPSQRSLLGALRATCSATPLGEVRLNPHTPQFSQASPMLALAGEAPETLPGAIRQILPGAIRRTLPEAIRQILPGEIRRTLPEATRQTHPVAAHHKGHQVATLPKAHPVAIHPRDHPAATHHKGHPAATHHRDHPVAAHPRDHQVAAPLKGHPVAAHPRDHPVAVHPRVPLAAFPTPGDKALLGHPVRLAHQGLPVYNRPSLLLSRSITLSPSRHQHHPGSKSPNQRISREGLRMLKSS